MKVNVVGKSRVSIDLLYSFTKESREMMCYTAVIFGGVYRITVTSGAL